jgi:hypothetical protein
LIDSGEQSADMNGDIATKELSFDHLTVLKKRVQLTAVAEWGTMMDHATVQMNGKTKGISQSPAFPIARISGRAMTYHIKVENSKRSVQIY